MPTSVPKITSAGQTVMVTPQPRGQERWDLVSGGQHPVGVQLLPAWSNNSIRPGIPRYVLNDESDTPRHALLIVTRLVSDRCHQIGANQSTKGGGTPHDQDPDWYNHVMTLREDIPFTAHAYRVMPGIEFSVMGADALMIMGAQQSLEWTTRNGDLLHPGDATLEELTADETGKLFVQLDYARVDVMPLDTAGHCEQLIGTAGTPEMVVPINAAASLRVRDNPGHMVPVCHHHRIHLPEAHVSYLCAGAGYCVGTIPNTPTRDMGVPLLIRLSELFAG